MVNRIRVMSPQKIFIKQSTRAKRMRISVRFDGTVIATKPTRVSESNIKKFIREKMHWIESKVAYFAKHPRVAAAAPKRLTKKEYTLLKKTALILVHEKLLHFNQFYNFHYKKVTVRNQKTRWGSCSRSGNLNFNYKILYLEPVQQDYIIVHELCHLAQLNHSKAFWNLVAQQSPNYKEIRKTLRKFTL